MIYREPILVQSEMARFEKIRYYGSTVTLYKDLMQALDTEIVIVVIVQYDDAENRPGAAWIASAIEVGSDPHYALLILLYFLSFRNIRLLNRSECSGLDSAHQGT